MIFLAATQALAVTTVMPLVSDDLDGARSTPSRSPGTLATSVIGMVAVGAWCDRRGPVLPLTTSVGALRGRAAHRGRSRPTWSTLVAGRLRAGARHRGSDRRALRRRRPRVPARTCTGGSSPRSRPRGSCPRSSGRSSPARSRSTCTGAGCSSASRRSPSRLRAGGPAGCTTCRSRTEDPGDATRRGAPRAGRVVVAVGALALSLAGGRRRAAAPAVVAASVVVIAVAARPLLPAGTLRRPAAGCRASC